MVFGNNAISNTIISMALCICPSTTIFEVSNDTIPFGKNLNDNFYYDEQYSHDEYLLNKAIDYQVASSGLYQSSINTDYVSYLNKVSKKDNEIRMVEIAKLENNWNGYDAKAISEGVIERTNRILHNIIVQPKIFPTANDSIQFEFYDRADLSKYLEFDISCDEILCNDEKISLKEINQKIAIFYGIS